MIRLFYAPPGNGKTAVMTALCVENMHGRKARTALKVANAEVAMLNANGFNVTPPKTNHLVYCSKLTIDVTSPNFGHRRSLEVAVERLAMGTVEGVKPQYIYSGSTLALDEIPEDIDSREWQEFSKAQSRYFAKHRKRNLTIYATCQDPSQCEKRFRMLAQITFVRNVNVFCSEYGEQTTVWQLYNWACYEDWAKGKEPTEETYVYNGDIRKAYDTNEGQEEFLVGLDKADFSAEYAAYPNFTPEGIAAYGKKNAIKSKKDKEKQ